MVWNANGGDDGVMRGFGSSSYGDAFADVYDDWYHDISDVSATVALLADLAGPGGDVLELGVGTGRLACPLADLVGSVTGIDSSERMLARLVSNDPHGRVAPVVGDMVDDLPPGPFDLVFVAYNTLFNLLSAERQQACFASVAAHLRPGGAFVVEVFVPRPPDTGMLDADRPDAGQDDTGLTVRSIAADRVVLSASRHDRDTQSAEGQFIEITEAGGVRLRPWAIRWSTPDELDEMAARAGFVLTNRWGDVDRSAFTADSARHVSEYRTVSSG
jgi:SAM-dependent methyltransferase